MLRVDASDLPALVRTPGGIDLIAEAKFVVVAGDPDPELEAMVAGVPAVFAGIDVATDDHTIAAVGRAVAAHPTAAVALAMLLRDCEGRSIAEGLVAESATYSMLQAGPDHRRWLADRRPERPDGVRPAPAGQPVDVRREDGTLRLTLTRPERHNAFSAEVRDALVEALAVAAVEPELDVVIDGTGPSFCAGGDLEEFGTGPPPPDAHILRLRRSVARAIADIAERVTVHVHGACVGAGVELPAFAGRVVADPDARFWLPELSMGLIPGAGGTVSVTRRVGRWRAAYLALTGEVLDAQTALAWGLVDELAPR